MAALKRDADAELVFETTSALKTLQPVFEAVFTLNVLVFFNVNFDLSEGRMTNSVSIALWWQLIIRKRPLYLFKSKLKDLSSKRVRSFQVLLNLDINMCVCVCVCNY